MQFFGHVPSLSRTHTSLNVLLLQLSFVTYGSTGSSHILLNREVIRVQLIRHNYQTNPCDWDCLLHFGGSIIFVTLPEYQIQALQFRRHLTQQCPVHQAAHRVDQHAGSCHVVVALPQTAHARLHLRAAHRLRQDVSNFPKV